MSERELLEAAARAAGIELDWWEVEAGDFDCDAGWYCDIKDTRRTWSPLTNDGDALRLAVRLRMKIAIDAHPTGFVAIYANDSFSLDTHEPIVHGDAASATRRAIVRAAAALGAAMEGKKA